MYFFERTVLSRLKLEYWRYLIGTHCITSTITPFGVVLTVVVALILKPKVSLPSYAQNQASPTKKAHYCRIAIWRRYYDNPRTQVWDQWFLALHSYFSVFILFPPKEIVAKDTFLQIQCYQLKNNLIWQIYKNCLQF